MLDLALHANTGEAEARAGMLGILRVARERGWDREQFLAQLTTTKEVQVFRDPPPGWHVELGFGKKHKHEEIGWIAEHHPSYLEWCLRECSFLNLPRWRHKRTYIKDALAWVEGGHRETYRGHQWW